VEGPHNINNVGDNDNADDNNNGGGGGAHRYDQHTSEVPDKQTNRPTTPNDDGATRYCSPTTMIINDPVQKWVDCLDVGHDHSDRRRWLQRWRTRCAGQRRCVCAREATEQKNKNKKQTKKQKKQTTGMPLVGV